MWCCEGPAGDAAAEGGAHRARGFAGAADWLACASGSTIRQASEVLETVASVAACPHTNEALVAGEVSVAQAGEIVRAEAEVPGVEAELVEIARGGTLGRVRTQARRRRVGAIAPEQLRARQHAVRTFHHGTTELGMVWINAVVMPEVGLPFVNRLEAETDRLVRRRRRDGIGEARSAAAADVFAEVIGRAALPAAPSVDLVLVADVAAWLRGHAHPGEVSKMVGGGPVPVATLRELAQSAFVKGVLHDGVEIKHVVHWGRRLPATLRTALELGNVPDFDGVTCVEQGCERRLGLEWDHIDPVANGGATSFDNLEARCDPHHQAKTQRDRQAGRLGTRPP